MSGKGSASTPTEVQAGILLDSGGYVAIPSLKINKRVLDLTGSLEFLGRMRIPVMLAQYRISLSRMNDKRNQ